MCDGVCFLSSSGRDKGETDTKGGSKTRLFSGIFWKEDQ